MLPPIFHGEKERRAISRLPSRSPAVSPAVHIAWIVPEPLLSCSGLAVVATCDAETGRRPGEGLSSTVAQNRGNPTFRVSKGHLRPRTESGAYELRGPFPGWRGLKSENRASSHNSFRVYLTHRVGSYDVAVIHTRSLCISWLLFRHRSCLFVRTGRDADQLGFGFASATMVGSKEPKPIEYFSGWLGYFSAIRPRGQADGIQSTHTIPPE